MGSWFAAYWTPEDLPNLRLCIKLWALGDAGKAKGTERTAYIRLADDLGITRKGQQDRRWKRPEPERDESEGEPSADPRSVFAGLRLVGNG